MVPGADLGISQGGGGADFQKNFVYLFLGRPIWFFELSQISIMTQIWRSYLRRRQIFEKRPKRAFLGTLENFY